MKFISTNRQSAVVDFKEATIRGQAPDKGLYFPEFIPRLDARWIEGVDRLTNEEIAFRVILPYAKECIPEESLFEIVRDTIQFQIPLVRVNEKIFSLELFHGPTLAFKDVGARFMSRCLGYFLKGEERKVTVLVATSGDTGGAVASGFYGVESVDVVILYPSGKVSPVQEKQLTALGKNIHAIEVEGSFDDCQHMVKQAFADPELNEKLFLTSANSINIARWLPQQFYYFFAHKQWSEKQNPPVICVPSGNFGNICAGILAWSSGLPVKHFIAACNVNDVVTRFLETENFVPQTAVPTLSNAMDVGNPSNFVRILEIFNHRFPDLKNMLSSYRVTDEDTLQTIRTVYNQYNYLLDPHGAVGYHSLSQYLASHPGEKGIFLETAHPVKFPEAVQKTTGKEIDIPSSLNELMSKEKKSLIMKPGYSGLKQYLMA